MALTISRRQRDLLRWGCAARRPLPWRATRDPWAVLVSEVMLQQTQVDRVVPRYHEFLQRFPTAAACAEAPVGDVIALWVGLGYNRRAVNLHRAAAAVLADHEGELPDDLDGLLALPGVGPYTARAVLVFAFERDMGVVDTNVGRILARWEGRALRPREAQAMADAATPAGDGWAWNQAMFDLGAKVCRRRATACDACPVRRDCNWQGRGPDPAEGSAAVSKPQARFAGSDREGRGRLIAALRDGPVAHDAVAPTMGWDDQARIDRVLADLEADGLITVTPNGVSFPAGKDGV